MRRRFFFEKKEKPLPRWSGKVHNRNLCFNGGNWQNFLLEFDRIDEEIVALWDNNKLCWGDYRCRMSEVEEARQLFMQFIRKENASTMNASLFTLTEMN